MCFAHQSSQTSADLIYGINSAGVGVGRVLRSGSFYMCPIIIVECILCSEMCMQHTARTRE